MAADAAKPAKTTRRSFLKRAALGAAAVALGGAADAFLIEPRWVKISRPVVGIPSLAPAWDGLRIAQLTDLHVGRYIGLDYVRDVVRMTLAESPDLIVFTGDLVSQHRCITSDLAGALKPLSAPLGIFSVPGNHDYWTDIDGVTALLVSAGVTPLTTRRVLFDRGGQALCLAGVDDLWEGRPSLDALADVGEDVPRVLLCHNPDYAEEMPAAPRVDLMLSGHTHGGQFKVPFDGRPRVPIRHPKYAAGLAQGPCCPVYTCVGLGMVGIPIRFNCRPEIAVITLRRAPARG